MVVRIPGSSPSDRSEVYTIDFREVAPGLANETMFKHDPGSARLGGLSIGVPGELRGLEEAHRRWGKLSWKRVVQPSVELAKGWNVDRELGKRIPVCFFFLSIVYLEETKEFSFQWFRDLMLGDDDWKAIFAPHGRLLREGEIIRRTNYSRTLSAIAEQGAEAFYSVRIPPLSLSFRV